MGLYRRDCVGLNDTGIMFSIIKFDLADSISSGGNNNVIIFWRVMSCNTGCQIFNTFLKWLAKLMVRNYFQYLCRSKYTYVKLINLIHKHRPTTTELNQLCCSRS